MVNNLTFNKFVNTSNEDSDEQKVVDFKFLTYKDTKFLSNFISDQGKILPRRATGVTVQQQRKIAKAIKRARILSLLPFLSSNETNYNKT